MSCTPFKHLLLQPLLISTLLCVPFSPEMFIILRATFFIISPSPTLKFYFLPWCFQSYLCYDNQYLHLQTLQFMNLWLGLMAWEVWNHYAIICSIWCWICNSNWIIMMQNWQIKLQNSTVKCVCAHVPPAVDWGALVW